MKSADVSHFPLRSHVRQRGVKIGFGSSLYDLKGGMECFSILWPAVCDYIEHDIDPQFHAFQFIQSPVSKITFEKKFNDAMTKFTQFVPKNDEAYDQELVDFTRSYDLLKSLVVFESPKRKRDI